MIEKSTPNDLSSYIPTNFNNVVSLTSKKNLFEFIDDYIFSNFKINWTSISEAVLFSLIEKIISASNSSSQAFFNQSLPIPSTSPTNQNIPPQAIESPPIAHVGNYQSNNMNSKPKGNFATGTPGTK